MIADSKKQNNQPNGDEKKWDNPQAPALTGDNRDAEQLERQIKEAERRKENLTDEGDEEKKETN